MLFSVVEPKVANNFKFTAALKLASEAVHKYYLLTKI